MSQKTLTSLMMWTQEERLKSPLLYKTRGDPRGIRICVNLSVILVLLLVVDFFCSSVIRTVTVNCRGEIGLVGFF